MDQLSSILFEKEGTAKSADSTTTDNDDFEEEGTIDYTSDEKSENGGNCHKNGELKRPDLKGSFRCSICSKIFCHSSSLSRHRMQAHFRSYRCTICRKDISSSESLRSHMFKQHHISRMYMCRCCNWAFPDKSSLHFHLQSTSESIRHSVINRNCNVVNDPYQRLASPIFENNNVLVPSFSNSIIIPPQTASWLASLPKPIPTTAPVVLSDIKAEEPISKNERFSQSPSGSSISFKSDSQASAFHQLNAEPSRGLIISPVGTASPACSSTSRIRSPTRNECFECQVNKSKLTLADNKCKYLESRANTLQNETVDAQSKVTSLELTVHRLRMESQVLRDHNEMFQRKLLDCQSLAVRFLQSNKIVQPSEIQAFLNHLVNSTILSS